MQKISGNVIIITLLGILLILSGIAWYITKPQQTSNFLLAGFNKCASVPNNKDCLRTLAANTTIPLPTIFNTISEHEKEPALFGQCHTYLHFLGQFTLEKKEDIGQTLRQGNSICFSGFYHGALEIYLQKHLGAVDDGELIKLLPGVCEPLKSDSPKNFSECLHGLGHSLMFFADLELPRALEWCDTLPDGGQQTWCYGGAFMENTTSSTNPDHPGKFLKEEDPLYPCSILADKYLGSCYTLQGHYFVEKSQYDFDKATALCLSVPANYQSTCFNAIGQTIVGYTTDAQKLATLCDKLPTEDRFKESCNYSIIRSSFERYDKPFDQTLEICNLRAADKQSACKKSIISSWQATDPADYNTNKCRKALRTDEHLCM